jgi:hypothetical protein
MRQHVSRNHTKHINKHQAHSQINQAKTNIHSERKINISKCIYKQKLTRTHEPRKQTNKTDQSAQNIKKTNHSKHANAQSRACNTNAQHQSSKQIKTKKQHTTNMPRKHTESEHTQIKQTLQTETNMPTETFQPLNFLRPRLPQPKELQLSKKARTERGGGAP